MDPERLFASVGPRDNQEVLDVVVEVVKEVTKRQGVVRNLSDNFTDLWWVQFCDPRPAVSCVEFRLDRLRKPLSSLSR